jgi:aldehyde dehydrogenase (NAD+)
MDRYDGFERQPIAGTWRAGRSRRRGEDRDPFSGELLLALPLADVADVDEAYRAAARAQRAWAAAPPGERRDVLLRAAAIMERRKEELVGWLVRESGSSRLKSLLEWQLAHDIVIEAASFPFHLDPEALPSTIPGKESRAYRRPVGVVGVISPWNFPLHLTMRSLAPALACGNGVVVKPASDTPITGGLIHARLFEEAGLPPGVLSVVCGAGSELGDAFVEHPVPRVISFTGSTPVGQHVAELAGRQVKRVCLELGGNSPFVVLDDADLDAAAAAAAFGKWAHQGQICIAINRIIVDDEVHDAFVEKFIARTRALESGDPADPDVMIGPLINRKQLDHLRDLVARTVAAGAQVALDGECHGLVQSPIVLTGVTNDMPAAREEQFGPLACIVRARDEDDAVRIANDTDLGLSSGVFCGDLARGLGVAQRLEAGMTHVNDSPVHDDASGPFGGVKKSGLGRFGGAWALQEFTSEHWVTVQRAPRPYPTSARQLEAAEPAHAGAP